MKKWRNELINMMIHTGCTRTPVLRRSNKTQFLLATDFPLITDKNSMTAFMELAETNGWQTITDRGWIHLNRKAVFEAAEEIPDPGPEAACCLSLINRHPNEMVPSDGTAERLMLKAMEQGTEACERICCELHAEWAASLRKHKGIPDIDKRFFGGQESIC